jgi:KaiC/GvpD/RAD55 family RecA-like ATPase
VLGVYDTTFGRQFVLVGLRKGKTCLQVKINRDKKECIDVRVLAPEE